MLGKSESGMTIKNVELQALNFERLVDVIRQVHDELSAQASRAVNGSLTLRNWLIGLYVEEYERQGVDRVDYGDKLMGPAGRMSHKKWRIPL